MYTWCYTEVINNNQFVKYVQVKASRYELSSKPAEQCFGDENMLRTRRREDSELYTTHYMQTTHKQMDKWTGNLRINVTLRRVSVTIVQVEKQ